MKNIKILFIITLFSMIFAGCTHIATPEELIEPPELNVEKKSMKEALEKFLPENSMTTALPTLEGVDNEMAFSPIDLNDDKKSEMIAFYKDKDSKTIGMLILSKNGENWEKVSDIKLNAFDIIQFKVQDLNADKNKEIVLGMYSDESLSYGTKLMILGFNDNQVFTYLDMLSYFDMALGDLDKDGIYEIVILYQSDDATENRLRIVRLSENQAHKVAERVFEQGIIPYAVVIGTIYGDEDAIFVDSFSGIYEGQTDIFFFKDKKIKDIEEYKGFKLSTQAFPIQTKDIDSDGIIEVGIPFLPPDNTQPYDPLKPWVKSYYKITEDSKMLLVKQIYEDYNMGFLLEVPESFKNRYSITSNETMDKIEINFIARDKTAYKLAEIKMINKDKWKETEEVLQIISETSEYIVGGRVEDLSGQLDGEDKEQYIKMRSDILNLTNITKPTEI